MQQRSRQFIDDTLLIVKSRVDLGFRVCLGEATQNIAFIQRLVELQFRVEVCQALAILSNHHVVTLG